MLIEKGSISREIDEKNLQSFLNKGYFVKNAAPQKLTDDAEIAQTEKPLSKMTVAELKNAAAKNSIDISAAKNKEGILDIIFAAEPAKES